MKKTVVTLSKFLVIILFMTFTYGCASTIKAIDHAEKRATVRMSDSIFISPKSLAKNNTVYVRVTNTSSMQEIDFESILENKLSKQGLEVTTNPINAGFIIQANVLYMDYAKDATMTADGMSAGGFGGALIGAGLGRGGLTETIIGGVIGAGLGAIAGRTVEVGSYIGTVDVQIQERVDSKVKGVVKADIKQGAGTVIQTEKEVATEYITYKTRIAGQIKQTNIDRNKAAMFMSERLATQIAGIFRR